jgi:hypothetical protein
MVNSNSSTVKEMGRKMGVSEHQTGPDRIYNEYVPQRGFP